MTRHIRRLLHFAETALLRYGTQPRTMFFLAALSALDGFVPMLPAEAFVVALCILQPQRGKFIVMLFAAASALSALLWALLFGTLSSSAVVGKLHYYAGLRVSEISREIREVDSEINGDFLGMAISVMGLADCANKASSTNSFYALFRCSVRFC